MGCRFEARRRERQLPLRAQPVDVALQERKVSVLHAMEARVKIVRGRGQAGRSSAGGWRRRL